MVEYMKYSPNMKLLCTNMYTCKNFTYFKNQTDTRRYIDLHLAFNTVCTSIVRNIWLFTYSLFRWPTYDHHNSEWVNGQIFHTWTMNCFSREIAIHIQQWSFSCYKCSASVRSWWRITPGELGIAVQYPLTIYGKVSMFCSREQ